MIRKELWFGFILMAIILATVAVLMPWSNMTNGHLGLLMLGLVVVAIMLGFPTAFTLMGMGMMFAFFAYFSRSDGHAERALQQTLDLMVQSTFGVMRNDVLISIPLFVFMGYLVERANLISKLFKSLHLALARVPSSLAVATLVTCAIFATATGIVGAVVTLMGLLALPAMLRAGYDVRLSAGVITAGGCLGILIPPSVLLIVYGATAGVSVPKLYAGAFFPGIMLALLYIGYVIIIGKWKPHLAPPLSAADRVVTLPPANKQVNDRFGERALPSLLQALKGERNAEISTKVLLKQLGVALAPLLVFVVIMGLTWNALTRPDEIQDVTGLQEMGTTIGATEATPGGLAEPPGSSDLKEPSPSGVQEPPGAEPAKAEAAGAAKVADKPVEKAATSEKKAHSDFVRDPTPPAFWYVFGVGMAMLIVFYGMLTFARLEIFKMLLTSFFPLSVMILAVLGTILFGLATPTEAAAVGSLGGFILASVYLLLTQSRENIIRSAKIWIPLWLVFLISVVWFILFKAEVVPTAPTQWVGWLSLGALGIWALVAMVQAKMIGTVRESTYLTAKTSAMVCWLFVGSSIFSAAFALLGGQNIVEAWVLSLGLTPVQFMLLAQCVIFILGWPLEWTEIIVIFMPIFIPLLPKFGIDPLFFGLLVALNLQTAFLSPPVAMAAFYLKGVSPPHVTLNQIFAGMMPFMGIQILAIILLYLFPAIGMWLPNTLYAN
jgi:TRAP-type mannitol/chloroaromatic compound transport system permease large subunit